jgi:hypothetical protein
MKRKSHSGVIQIFNYSEFRFDSQIDKDIVPLSKTNPEAIESIRVGGRGRAVPASGQPLAHDTGQPRARRSVLV